MAYSSACPTGAQVFNLAGLPVMVEAMTDNCRVCHHDGELGDDAVPGQTGEGVGTLPLPELVWILKCTDRQTDRQTQHPVRRTACDGDGSDGSGPAMM
jgi:hypothetical protein